MCATAAQGCRFRTRADNSARWERRQRPHHYVAGKSIPTPAAASRAREGATRAGCRRWVRQGPSSICVKSKVAERRTRMGLAIRFSLVANFGRSAQRNKTTAPHGRRYLAERTQESGGRGGNSQTRQLPQSAPFLCHAPTGKRL